MTLHRRYQRARIQAFQEGELPEARQDALARHLERCQECADELRRLNETERLLTDAQPEPARLSAAASQALFERAFANAALPAPPARGSDARLRLVRYGAAALVLGIAVGIFGWRSLRTPLRPSGGTAEDTQTAFVPKSLPASPANPHALPVPHADSALVKNFLPDLMPPELTRDLSPPAPKRRHSRPRFRRHLSEPARFPLVAASVHALSSSWRKLAVSGRSVEAGAFEPRRAEQLLVVLENPPPPAPTLAVQVTHEPETTPGYAQAAAYQPESLGRGTWTQCTVSQHDTGTTAARFSLASVNTNQEKAFLDVQIASGGEANAKGANP
ncbi:MAG TPA: zf-HC2 domain-containing protein [Chthonomonadaceae bacterium]|nr:zf-HC2 domain-containing protein [Chthonomonadaceae bacterium]